MAPEFTSLCPLTGQPDFAHLVIDYSPARWLVESKSLKLYLNSFNQHRFVDPLLVRDTLVAAFPSFVPEDWSPAVSLSTLGHLLVLGLVHHVGWYEPILPGHPGQQDLTLDPNLVVGEVGMGTDFPASFSTGTKKSTDRPF